MKNLHLILFYSENRQSWIVGLQFSAPLACYAPVAEKIRGRRNEKTK